MGEISFQQCLTISRKGSATGKGLAHKDDFYETPWDIVRNIESETGLKFNIDVCADEKNKKCHYYISETDNALTVPWKQSFAHPTVVFCNPPRSKNGKFVRKTYDEWLNSNIDIVILVCWNDLGNKYGEKCILPYLISGDIKVGNLGKVKFDKNGIPSKHVSRLTYFWAWYKKRGK